MVSLILIAWRNVIKNRARSLIVGGAIVAITILMLVLLSMISGIQHTLLHQATALASGHVNIAGFYKVSQSSSAPMILRTPELRKIAKSTVPEATLMVDRVKAWGKLISDTQSIQTAMWGIDVESERPILQTLANARFEDYIPNWKSEPGKPQSAGNIFDLARQGSVAIFASHAKKLGVRVGDTITVSLLTTRNIYNTRDCKIVAVLQDMGLMSSFSVFLNQRDTRELYQLKEDTTGQLMIFLPDVAQTVAVQDRLRAALSRGGFQLMEPEAVPFWAKFDRVSGESWKGFRVDVTNWRDETSYVKWVIDIFNVLTFLLVGILLLITLLGLMNMLYMAIRERTREIGTLRAIGLQRRGVLFMFAAEAFLLTVMSVFIGVLIGSALVMLLNAAHFRIDSEAFRMFLMSSELVMIVRPGDILTVVLLIVVFLGVGVLLPSYRASKMKPITAINEVS